MNPRCFPTDRFVPYFTTAILQAVKKTGIAIGIEFRVLRISGQYEPSAFGTSQPRKADVLANVVRVGSCYIHIGTSAQNDNSFSIIESPH